MHTLTLSIIVFEYIFELIQDILNWSLEKGFPNSLLNV